MFFASVFSKGLSNSSPTTIHGIKNVTPPSLFVPMSFLNYDYQMDKYELFSRLVEEYI